MKTVRFMLIGSVLLVGVVILPSMLASRTLQMPASWNAYAQQVATAEGQVVSISFATDSFVMKVRRVRNCDLKGATLIVVWDEDTQWTRGKRTASPSELWIGASVTVTGAMVDGQLLADTVQIGGTQPVARR